MDEKKHRVDAVIEVERMYGPDLRAMKAALRVVLRWPPVLEEAKRDEPRNQSR